MPIRSMKTSARTRSTTITERGWAKTSALMSSTAARQSPMLTVICSTMIRYWSKKMYAGSSQNFQAMRFATVL